MISALALTPGGVLGDAGGSILSVPWCAATSAGQASEGEGWPGKGDREGVCQASPVDYPVRPGHHALALDGEDRELVVGSNTVQYDCRSGREEGNGGVCVRSFSCWAGSVAYPGGGTSC